VDNLGQSRIRQASSASGWHWGRTREEEPSARAGGVGADLGGRVPQWRSSSIVEPSSWVTGNPLLAACSHHARKGGPQHVGGGVGWWHTSWSCSWEEASRLNGGSSSCGAAARHTRKAEVETAPLSSSPPALPLSSFLLTASRRLLCDAPDGFFSSEERENEFLARLSPPMQKASCFFLPVGDHSRMHSATFKCIFTNDYCCWS
jgi:hypothetical protein